MLILSPFILLLILSLIIIFFFKILFKNNFTIYSNKFSLTFGILFFLSGTLNILTIMLNGFEKYINFRFLLIIFITSFLLIFYQKQQLSFLKICSKIFKIFFTINLLIILSQIILYYLGLIDLMIKFQLLIGDKNFALIDNTRHFLGVGMIRPLGIFGGFQGGNFILVTGIMTWIMSTITNNYIRYLLWIATLLGCLLNSAGQSSLTVLICALSFEFLISSKKNKIILILVISPIIVFLFYLGIKSSTHTQLDKHDSMLQIYINSPKVIKYLKNPSCYIFGCSLNDSQSALISKVKYKRKFDRLLDVGLITFSFSFGIVYLTIYCLAIIFYYKYSNLKKRTRVILFTIGLAQLSTLSHYPVGWGSGVFAFLLLSFFHIQYKYTRLY